MTYQIDQSGKIKDTKSEDAYLSKSVDTCPQMSELSAIEHKNDELFLKIKEILLEVLGETQELKIDENSNLKLTLGVDSFTATEILVLVEKEFNIKIGLTHLASLNTIKDVVDLIRIIKNG